MAQWISYLAYQKGDVSQNISKLEKAISDGEQMVSAAKERLETEEAQMKTNPLQKQEVEEEAIQGKFEKPAQMMEEEEETMQKWYVWLEEMKKKDERKRIEELHQQKVNQMMKECGSQCWNAA